MPDLKTSALQTYGVNAVGPADPEFDFKLKAQVGESYEELSHLIDIAKPISILIINGSEKDIVGCSLKWEITNPTGKHVYPHIRSTPGVLMGIKPIDPKMEGRTSLIPAGESRIFSFNSIVEQTFLKLNSQGNNEKKGSARMPYLPESVIREIEFSTTSLIHSASRFSVSIDGIFFSDGTFAGADSFFFFDSMRGQIEARHDFLSLLFEAESDADFTNILTSQTALNRNNRPKSRRPETPEEAFSTGYNSVLLSLSEEISKRRSKFADSVIAEEFLSNHVSKKIALRKLQ